MQNGGEASPCIILAGRALLVKMLIPLEPRGAYESFYKNEGIWEEKKQKKITQLILIFFFHLKLNPKHLTTIIHSFRQENSNNNNFRFMLMAAHVKNVIPVTTTMNLIS